MKRLGLHNVGRFTVVADVESCHFGALSDSKPDGLIHDLRDYIGSYKRERRDYGNRENLVPQQYSTAEKDSVFEFAAGYC